MIVIYTLKLHRNVIDIFILICIIPCSAFFGCVIPGIYLIVGKVPVMKLRILIEIQGNVDNGPKNRWLHFGDVLDSHLNPKDCA